MNCECGHDVREHLPDFNELGYVCDVDDCNCLRSPFDIYEREIQRLQSIIERCRKEETWAKEQRDKAESENASLREYNNSLITTNAMMVQTFNQAYDLLVDHGGRPAGLVGAIHNLLAERDALRGSLDLNLKHYGDLANRIAELVPENASLRKRVEIQLTELERSIFCPRCGTPLDVDTTLHPPKKIPEAIKECSRLGEHFHKVCRNRIDDKWCGFWI